MPVGFFVPQICEKTCGFDANCAAWTYVRPRPQGPPGRCRLKSRYRSKPQVHAAFQAAVAKSASAS
jgi:hypothetical protein